MTREDDERGTADDRTALDVVRDVREQGMKPGQAKAVADLLPSMVRVAASEWSTPYSGWNAAASVDDLLKTAIELATATVLVQEELRRSARS